MYLINNYNTSVISNFCKQNNLDIQIIKDIILCQGYSDIKIMVNLIKPVKYDYQTLFIRYHYIKGKSPGATWTQTARSIFITKSDIRDYKINQVTNA